MKIKWYEIILASVIMVGLNCVTIGIIAYVIAKLK